MRALVTGSSGFLGQHVCADLASRPGFRVTGFDLRPAPGSDPPTIEGDLCDLDAVSEACRDMDVVVHFGGVGDVDVAAARPELAAQANVVGTTNVAIASARAGARVVYASTWEVYAPSGSDPVDERHQCDPGHVYGATKLAGEQILRAFRRGDGLPVFILRLGTAYGPGMRPNTVFRRFADAAKTGQPVVVHGTGHQWRQFTHVSDIGRAVWLATISGDGYRALNIVSEECVTIRRLAEIVSSHYGVPVTFGPERHGDPPSARVSSAEASLVLGWKAEVPFLAGLEQLLTEVDAAH